MVRKINLLTENHNALPRRFTVALGAGGGHRGHSGVLLAQIIWKGLQHIVQINTDWSPFDRYMCPKIRLKLGWDLCSHLAFAECVVLRGVCSSFCCSEKQRMIGKLVHRLQ